MNYRNLLSLSAALCMSAVAAFAQAADTPFQVRTFANLNIGDSVINMTNSGASGTVITPANGQLCANFYAYGGASGTTMLGCCSCLLEANQGKNVLVKTDILGGSNPTNNSVVVKAMGSIAAGGTTCSPSTVGTGSNVLATGMLLWGTTVHALPRVSVGTTPPPPTSTLTVTSYGVTETAFTPSTLSAAELTRLNSQCLALSTPAICNSCRAGHQ